jgi:limonene-1,2-epoxide hydrolase
MIDRKLHVKQVGARPGPTEVSAKCHRAFCASLPEKPFTELIEKAAKTCARFANYPISLVLAKITDSRTM